MLSTAQRWLDSGHKDSKKLCKTCVKNLKLKAQPAVVIDLAKCYLCKEVVVLAYGKGGCKLHRKKHLEMVCTWDVFASKAPRRRRKARVRSTDP